MIFFYESKFKIKDFLLGGGGGKLGARLSECF